MTAGTGIASAAWQALGTVLDPELDEPITDLDFIANLEADENGVRVDLRLPTYFCAPNFAYLMVADAQDALLATPGVRNVRVRLLDHFAAEEINAGVAAGEGFDSAFPVESEGELEELRRTFLRKAHAAYQQQVADQLLDTGFDHADLVRSRLAVVPESDLVERLRRRRDQLGWPSGPDSMLLLDDDGQPMGLAGLPLRLRMARTTGVSIEANAAWCRGLLGTRYGESADPETARCESG
ncbi:iron-sulfur cluster assembly protein [Parasphingorhabdus pacifica]